MTLRVLDPGLQSQLVDHGRPSSRSLGVPVGGAADVLSLALGNALVGNPPACAALEIAVTGPTLQTDTDLGAVLLGAPFDLACDREPLVAGRTFTLRAGETLRIRGTNRGMRAYLCVPGGFAGLEVLGSRSTLEPLRASQELACGPSSLPLRFLADDAPNSIPNEPVHTLRVLAGAQAERFDMADAFSRSFKISAASNRMGLRLESEPLPVTTRELVSEPVCPGTVQVTHDGQCIILGVDGQTIGGYPKLAQVIRADLDFLGQLRPGAQICFQPVSLAQAESAFARRQARLQSWLTRIALALDCSSSRSNTSL